MTIKSVTDEVVDYLRTNIIIGKLKPGQKLEENPLSSRIGVSRPPLREAFRILERERIVINIPRRGTFVSEISNEELQSVFEAREMIESSAIKLFRRKGIKRVPEAEISLEMAADMSVPPLDNPKEYLAYYQVMSDFHFKIIEATENMWLIKFKYEIYPTQARYRLLNIKETQKSGSLERSLEDHQGVLSALGNGNYEQAKEIMKAHVRWGLFHKYNIPESNVKELKIVNP